MLRGFAYGEEGYDRLRQARESTPRPPSLVNEANGLFDSAEADFRTTTAKIDKAGLRRVLHPNTAARRKSKLARDYQAALAKARA